MLKGGAPKSELPKSCWPSSAESPRSGGMPQLYLRTSKTINSKKNNQNNKHEVGFLTQKKKLKHGICMTSYQVSSWSWLFDRDLFLVSSGLDKGE